MRQTEDDAGHVCPKLNESSQILQWTHAATDTSNDTAAGEATARAPCQDAALHD